MPVLEHARTAKPEGYSSDNHRKWEYNNGLYQKHLEWYLDRLHRYLKRTGAKTVLDAGCGEGIVYRAMRERGWEGSWTGFDFSDEAVRFAKQASPEAEWHQGSAYDIKHPDNSFDLVLCSQVLEHLPKPGDPLKEMERTAGKWLLLSVPLEPFFRSLTWLSTKLKLGGDPGHVNFWSGTGFRAFAGSAGRLRVWDRSTVYQIALVEVR